MPVNFPGMFYTDFSQFSAAATDASLSNFYYQSSRTGGGQPFRVLAEAFPDRINVPFAGALDYAS
jgi:hypothetical protein